MMASIGYLDLIPAAPADAGEQASAADEAQV
jgi:hypothetical protein